MADIQHSDVEANVDVLDPERSLLLQPHETLQNEQVCSANPDTRKDMGVYALAVHPDSSASSEDDIDSSPCEPYPGFGTEIQR